jgi:hypothetical protein
MGKKRPQKGSMNNMSGEAGMGGMDGMGSDMMTDF